MKARIATLTSSHRDPGHVDRFPELTDRNAEARARWTRLFFRGVRCADLRDPATAARQTALLEHRRRQARYWLQDREIERHPVNVTPIRRAIRR